MKRRDRLRPFLSYIGASFAFGVWAGRSRLAALLRTFYVPTVDDQVGTILALSQISDQDLWIQL